MGCLYGCTHARPLFLRAPVVSSLSVQNSALSGGLHIQFGGLEFGTSNLTPSVMSVQELSTCESASWVSATTMACRSPEVQAAVASSPAVGVTVNSVVGTKTGLFTFDGADCGPLFVFIHI